VAIKVVAIVLALAAGVVVYVVLGSSRDAHDAPSGFEVQQRRCGAADLLNGADANSCMDLAWSLMGRSDVPVDDTRARALLKKLCDQAYDTACSVLKEFAANKLFVAEGRCTASWFKPADAKACTTRARAFEEGADGSRRDPAEAKKWYAKACALGVGDACNR
jgi:TPR repeat protein